MPGWWMDTLSFLSLGIRWRTDEPENPLLLESASNPLYLAGIAGLTFLVAFGVISLWRSRWRLPMVPMVAGSGVGLVLLWLNALWFGGTLLWWYALPVLPVLAVASGAALGPGIPGRGRAAICALVAFPLLASWATVLPVHVANGKADPRSLVRMARGGDFPEYDPGPITLTLWSDAGSYDPRMRWLDDGDFLDMQIERARAEGLELFVLTAHEGRAALTHPDVMDRLRHSGDFELVHTAWSTEARTFTNRLYRWQGGGDL